MRSLGWIVAAFTLVWVTGCDRFISEYGNSKGVVGRQSLNGFGGFRRAFQSSGFETRDVTRLTERVGRSDVIVWTPQEFGPIPADATEWFEKWLQKGNRTLVYVIPDSGSEVDYWRDASRLAPPSQRLEYRKRAAGATNQRATWRLNRLTIPSNGWFVVSPSVSQTVPASDGGSIDTELSLSAYSNKSKAPTTAATTAAVPGFGGTGTTGPNSFGFSTSTTSATDTKVAFDPEFSNADGQTIVARIQSDRWDQSQVIVVAGGSLLTNFALTRSFGRDLANQIIDESHSSLVNQTEPENSDPPQAGFLTTDWTGVSISERKPGAPIASGMELLTVWPISLVTIHGVLLGLVVCLMLLPIFGRPKKVRRVDHSDFGDHLDAVAALMNKAGGEEFARQRISEYFKRIRGENSGPWVQPDTTEQASFTMHQLTTKTDSSESS